MAHDEFDEPDREDRRNQVLLAYVEALEEGRDPDRDLLLAEHPDLRPDLEAFLAGHDVITRMTAPARSSPGSSPLGPYIAIRDEPGEIIHQGLGELGDFRLLREVGRGGMGVVYEAEQISLRRRVALKVLPFAAAIDPRRLQRFKVEALAAAHAPHEKIVPVHAVGCERGVHYYAMQFIDGQSLAALIGELRRLRDERRGSAGTIEENVDPFESDAARDATSMATTIARERSIERRRYFDRAAGLVRQAAVALEHAHQAGIVHRDIKPGNLLLDLRGQLWVTDFGLAQVRGDTGLTMSGELLGTLRYASPEQLLARRGIVDHRSDVYSLGATLYELVTLRPPFDGQDRNALIRQVVDDPPPAPRSLDPALPAELETIVLKALRKEPAERYGSAQELADDLERFVLGRPIEARRPTIREQTRAWSRRHPAIVGSGVVGLILLSVASMVSTAIVRREQAKTLAEQRKAEAAYRGEHQRALEAEARFFLARRAVDELIRASEEELARRPGFEGLRKRLLGAALVYYREFIAERRSDPHAQAELLDTTRRVETILADLAVLRAAGQLYLLIQPTALDDLKLDESQRARVAELSARAAARWSDAFGNAARPRTSAGRERIALEQARANEAEVDAILTPAQRVRLRQIALQAEGPAAFREPEVVEALGLLPDQRDQIRTIEDEAFFSQIRERQMGKSTDDVAKSAVSRVLALLTQAQAERWKELAGDPVEGPLSAFPAPIRRPREPARESRARTIDR